MAETSATTHMLPSPPAALSTRRQTTWRLSPATVLAAAAVTWVVGGILAAQAIAAFSRVWPGMQYVAYPGVLGLGAFLALVATVWALARIWRAGSSQRQHRGRDVLAGVAVVLGGSFMTLWGAFWALWATSGFARGRQLRRLGRPLLAGVQPGNAWAPGAGVLDVPAQTAAALAGQWRQNGRTEHASVAAFARLTLDLMALGAGPKLLADAQRDAMDEIHHTSLCFGLAQDIDGQAVQPAPFPQAQRARTLVRNRTAALAQLAVDSLVDGALHEGVSAAVVARLAHSCTQPRVREVLRQIARDEGRHAAHGWDVVQWCLAEGGWPVACALDGALRMVPTTIRAPAPPEARSGAWERWGIPGAALEQAAYQRTRAYAVERVAGLMVKANAELRAGATLGLCAGTAQRRWRQTRTKPPHGTAGA